MSTAVTVEAPAERLDGRGGPVAGGDERAVVLGLASAEAVEGGGVLDESAKGGGGIGVKMDGGPAEGATAFVGVAPCLAKAGEGGEGVLEGALLEGGLAGLGGEVVEASDCPPEVGGGVVASKVFMGGAGERAVEVIPGGEGLTVDKQIDCFCGGG